MASEFSHTVMHGQKLAKQLPPGGRAASASALKRPPLAPAAAGGKFNPASVYAPANKKAKENRCVICYDGIDRPFQASTLTGPVGPAAPRMQSFYWPYKFFFKIT